MEKEEVRKKVEEMAKEYGINAIVSETEKGAVVVKVDGKRMALRKFEDWRVDKFLDRLADLFSYMKNDSSDEVEVDYKEAVKEQRKTKKQEKKIDDDSEDLNGVVLVEIGGVKTLVQKPMYSDVQGVEFEDVFRALDLSSEVPVVLQGEKGIGKSYTALVWLKERNIPYFRIDCSEDMTSLDMLGSFIVLNGEVYYKMSALGSALYWASQGKEVAVLFEELNVLPPSVLKGMNSLFDFKRSLLIPELGKVLGGKSLRIIATINYSSYQGTYDFSSDVRSRMIIANIIGEDKRKKLLKYDFGKLSDEEKFLIKVFDELNKQVANDYRIEYRDIQKFLKIFRMRQEQGVEVDKIYQEILGYLAQQYDNVEDVKGLIFQIAGVEVQ